MLRGPVVALMLAPPTAAAAAPISLRTTARTELQFTETQRPIRDTDSRTGVTARPWIWPSGDSVAPPSNLNTGNPLPSSRSLL